MVQVTISKLRILVIEVQLALWGDMHHHLAGNQAGLIFLTQDLECETTKRNGVISFDLPLGGGGEEAVQIPVRRQRSPGSLRIARWFGEALVVSRDKSFEEEVGLLQRINAGESHLFAESILKGLPEPLDATFGLGRERRNGANTELFDDALDLTLRFAAGQFVINGGLFRRAQNGVPVVIENVRQTMGESYRTQHQQIANLIFA